jgi:hypothetical protein
MKERKRKRMRMRQINHLRSGVPVVVIQERNKIRKQPGEKYSYNKRMIEKKVQKSRMRVRNDKK